MDPKATVRPGGFEPPTSWFVARQSVQLSYRRIASGFHPHQPYRPVADTDAPSLCFVVLPLWLKNTATPLAVVANVGKCPRQDSNLRFHPLRCSGLEGPADTEAKCGAAFLRSPAGIEPVGSGTGTPLLHCDTSRLPPKRHRAVDRDRTGDLHLGKMTRYQLRYNRERPEWPWYPGWESNPRLSLKRRELKPLSYRGVTACCRLLLPPRSRRHSSLSVSTHR